MSKFEGIILMKENRIELLKNELESFKKDIQYLAGQDIVDEMRIITEAKRVGDIQKEISMMQEEVNLFKALQ